MAEKKKKKKEKNNEANWVVSYSAKLDSRTKLHTQFGVSASNGSRDMAPTKVAEKKEKKMNIDNPIKHPLRGSLIRGVSTVNYCLPTFRTPSLYPQQFKRDPLGKRGFWVGVKLRKKKKSKKPQPSLSLNNAVRILGS